MPDNLTVALEAEWDSDDTHRQDSQLFRDTGDDRSSTSTSTSTHARRDERHARTVTQHLLDVLQTLLSSRTGTFRFVTGTQPFFTQLQMNRYGGVVQCLIVCITENEGHVMDTLAIHVVDGITATASNTDHFDDAVFLFG